MTDPDWDHGDHHSFRVNNADLAGVVVNVILLVFCAAGLAYCWWYW